MFKSCTGFKNTQGKKLPKGAQSLYWLYVKSAINQNGHKNYWIMTFYRNFRNKFCKYIFNSMLNNSDSVIFEVNFITSLQNSKEENFLNTINYCTYTNKHSFNSKNPDHQVSNKSYQSHLDSMINGI